MEVTQAGITFLLVVLITTLVAYALKKTIPKICHAIMKTDRYRKCFVGVLKFAVKNLNRTTTFIEISKPMYKNIEDKVLEIGGDVMEIGAGTGRSLDLLRLPEGSSLVVVDYNPFMEKAFRENLASAPHIKLKDYLVQSAADMSNIADNSFAVVYTIDVMCSLSEDDLRKMLEEAKRILKPGGCLFVFEHVLDEPGTWRRSVQKFLASTTGIWPFLNCGCHCDRETLKFIQETGFRDVAFRIVRLAPKNAKSALDEKVTLVSIYPFNCLIIGHAEK